jgi:hypothetical protein
MASISHKRKVSLDNVETKVKVLPRLLVQFIAGFLFSVGVVQIKGYSGVTSALMYATSSPKLATKRRRKASADRSNSSGKVICFLLIFVVTNRESRGVKIRTAVTASNAKKW